LKKLIIFSMIGIMISTSGMHDMEMVALY